MKYLSTVLILIALVVSTALAQDYTLNAFLKHDGDIEGIAFSEDGRTLASMGADRVLHYWNPHTEKAQPESEVTPIDRWSIDSSIVPEEPHKKPVNAFDTIRMAVAFPGIEDPHGLIATGSSDQTVWLQGFPSLRPLFRIQERGEIWAVALSPDGQTLASGGDISGIHLWDLNTISPDEGTIELKGILGASTGRVEGLAFSPDGQTLAVATGRSDGEAIHLWDMRTEQIREILIAKGVSIKRVAFSPDGQMIAGGAKHTFGGRNVLLWKWGPLSPARILHSVELDGPELVTALNKNFTFTVTVKNAFGQPLENVAVALNNPGASTDWQHNFFDSSNLSYDGNGDGIVNILDTVLLTSRFGQTNVVWTNSAGRAVFTLKFYDAGKHDIDVSVLDRATLTPALTQQFIDRVEVPKPHSITPEDAAPKFVEELENYLDTFIVKSEDGQTLEGFQVRISTAGVSQTVFSDNAGKATCNLRMSLAGTYDVHVTVHDYFGYKVWLQKTFPNRISVGSQCSTIWIEPNPRVLSEHRRMAGRTNGWVAILEDTLCDFFDNMATQQDSPTSSLMPCIRWTPAETVINDLGTTVITVAFLNGTSDEKKELMDTIRNGWEQHANIHFVSHSDSSRPSDVRIKFRKADEKKGNNSAPGITIPLVIADALYSTIHSKIGNNPLVGIMNATDGLIGWVPGLGWAGEEITNAVATASSVIGISYGRMVEAALISAASLSGYLKEETMNLTHKSKPASSRQSTILHEFGHALGFHHLHNNPAFPFEWQDKKVIYDHYKDNNGWDRDRVDNNIFDVVNLPPTATFDPDSIMAYNLPAEWIKAPAGASDDLKKLAAEGIKRKQGLSDGDKEAVAVVYGPPKDAYLVEGKIKIFGLDEDCPLNDSTDSETRKFQCVVAPQSEFSTIRLPNFYAGNEVRVEIHIGSRNIVNDEIEMKATVRLFEGTVLTQYISTDEEDEKTEPFSVPIDGSKLPDKEIRVENPKGDKIPFTPCYVGGDYATVTLQEFRATPFDSSEFVASAASAPSAASITATESRPSVPDNTTLLANYPNPFNPETWIPYRLAKHADVTLTIYSVDGKVVRHLDLGHQEAGVYQDKDSAAYWDGKNEQGELVASGLYFYTLKAGDFSATRKMLIRK